MKKFLSGWYVVDRARNNKVVRGPFDTIDEAAVARSEMEYHADEEQAERWNLWVVKI